VIWIRSAGDYCQPVEGDLPDLKGLVQEVAGAQVRRVGRFIRLALIGAGRCAGEARPASTTAVYMSSARGDLETTLEVVETLFRQGMPPKPLSFVNTVSNAPCYYVARQFDLAGRSNFICSRRFAFESVLELAMLDMDAGYMESALVGSVDVATSPVAEHRERLQIGPDEVVAEGSHWLWLQSGERPQGALGELVAARAFTGQDALMEWLQGLDIPAEQCAIVGGQFAESSDIDAIQAESGIGRRYAPPAAPGFYDSQSGRTISHFLREGEAPYLLHVNAENDGPRQTATLVRRETGPA